MRDKQDASREATAARAVAPPAQSDPAAPLLTPALSSPLGRRGRADGTIRTLFRSTGTP